MEYIHIDESGLHIVIGITEQRQVKLLHFGYTRFDEKSLLGIDLEQTSAFQLVQLSYAGCNCDAMLFGAEHSATAPGCLLRFVEMMDTYNTNGRHIEIVQYDASTGARVVSEWQFFSGLPIVRTWTTVTNTSAINYTLEYVSNFCYLGIEKEGALPYDDKLDLYIPYNSWRREVRWHKHKLSELGLEQVQKDTIQIASDVITVSNTGNWSTKEYLPLGYLANTEADTALFWQIEHNGSWQWEISDHNYHLYLNVGGPTEYHSHWSKLLSPGESFTTVPVAIGVSKCSLNSAFAVLTKYRRRIRRPNADNIKLPVIFNDYMNCLLAEPTTEKELPMIDAAADAGCEYYCIDAGWYSAGPWWDNVGEWAECHERFPNGLREVTNYIRAKKMIPGLWLEPEVMGIKCPLAAHLPDDFFFMRHGKRVVYRSRYQFDFRNPEVIKHMDALIDRLVSDYGIGYIKMDYNIEPGIGTDYCSDSCGDGLLEHNRAYIGWLDSLFIRYPELVIENCSSGGMRMDYSLLSRCSIQSVSDQEDYLPFAAISANAMSGVTPEQAAIWSYPQREERIEIPGSLRAEAELTEETIYNMVNAMLMRIHQSGHLPDLNYERRTLVKEGIACYKRIRNDIPLGVPFWPNGFAKITDSLLCSGLMVKNKLYLSVWRRGGDESKLSVPLSEAVQIQNGEIKEICCIYPDSRPCDFQYDADAHMLNVSLPKKVMARLIEVRFS